MNTEVFCLELVTLIAGMALATAAETNAVSQFDRLFILPEHQLRLFSTEPVPARTAPPKLGVNLSSLPAATIPAHVDAQRSSAFTLSTDGEGGHFRSYQFTQHQLDMFPRSAGRKIPGPGFLNPFFSPRSFAWARPRSPAPC